MARISDSLRLRGVVMLFVTAPAIISYAVIANITSNCIRYGMTFVIATGPYSSVALVLVWVSKNSAGHYKRATSTEP